MSDSFDAVGRVVDARINAILGERDEQSRTERVGELLQFCELVLRSADRRTCFGLYFEIICLSTELIPNPQQRSLVFGWIDLRISQGLSENELDALGEVLLDCIPEEPVYGPDFEWLWRKGFDEHSCVLVYEAYEAHPDLFCSHLDSFLSDLPADLRDCELLVNREGLTEYRGD